MKKFLLKVVLFFLALIIVDRALGDVFAYMGDNAKGGYIGHHKYVTDKVNEDILIFGSSRAIHHYNPQIISDSLGMSCYNCGQDGNGIILFYGLWQMIKERHKPKMIIYDITPDFDILELEGKPNQRYLGWLRANYDRSGIKEIFVDVEPLERYKMCSWLYRYNSRFIQISQDYLRPRYKIKDNGYLPLEGEMDTMKISKEASSHTLSPSCSLKMSYINKFIDETKELNLIFVVSPSWYGINYLEVEPIRKLCERRHITFIDYSNQSKYVHNNTYFSDGNHLNARGADEFTKELINILKVK